MNKQDIDQLCRYFLRNTQHLTYVERLEILYIYEYLSALLNDGDMQRILSEVDTVRITLKIRGRKRSLNYVYKWCKTKAIIESGRYDTTTLRLPPSDKLGNYY